MSAELARRKFLAALERLPERLQDARDHLDGDAFVVTEDGTEWADGWDEDRLDDALHGRRHDYP